MTKNQRNLILLINHSLAKGIMPSITQMMAGIGALSNKSVFRAISSLTKNGYLVQVGKKISNVIPTDKARSELMLNQLRSYCPPIQPVSLLRQENISPNDATIATTNYIGPLGTDIKNDGTTACISDIKTIVQASNTDLPEKFQSTGPLSNILNSLPEKKESNWTTSGIKFLIVSSFLFGKDPFVSTLISCTFLLVISKITNQPK